MTDKSVVVLDIGKTFSKLTLWDAAGVPIDRETRRSTSIDLGAFQALDVGDIEGWLISVLQKFARLAKIDAIVPVAHGAAVAVVREGKLACPIIDYENSIPKKIQTEYNAVRDDFHKTGSPRLPYGLNLGVQLHWLEEIYPEIFSPGTQLLTYPQYWAWRLCGEPATEVTSLGCHTDLWCPQQRTPSPLAISRGWSDMFAPLRPADEVLGHISPPLAKAAGLPLSTKVCCGIHDSNASLLASRGFDELRDREFTTLSTGTWFVAMRSPAHAEDYETDTLPNGRDCLINVDWRSNPVPSARFMGGREIEILTEDSSMPDHQLEESDLLLAVERVVDTNVCVFPTWTPRVGPFPDRVGHWINQPSDDAKVYAAAHLYAALVADTSLSLIGARERVLVEGRFSKSETFVRALAALRPDIQWFRAKAEQDVSYGALRLAGCDSLPYQPLEQIQPLSLAGLNSYAEKWQSKLS